MRRAYSVILFSLALAGLAVPVASEAQVICTGNASPPPELPVYEQPPIPAPGYVWVPGYWGIGPVGYYWVPGHLGPATYRGLAVDTGLLGLARRNLPMEPRLLGPPRWLLWRRHLRLWLWRRRL